MKTGLLIAMAALAAAALGQTKAPVPLPTPGNVTLPLDEYNKLVDLANKPAKPPEAPPLAYAIERVDLKLEAGSDAVRGTMQWEGEVFHAGLTKVPLTSGVTILDAQQKGKGTPLLQEGGTHTAVLTGPGAFSIAVTAAMALRIEAGRASFRIPALAASAVRLSLTVPGEHTDVRMTPGLITGRTSSGGRTTVEATLAPAAATLIVWATREAPAQAGPKETRFLSDVKTAVSVRDGEMGVAALATVTVVQGEPRQFEMEIPAGYEVTEAAGVSLESSESKAGVLTLKVNDAKKRSHEFLISLEKATNVAKEEVALPGFRGSQRETGEALVDGEGTIELTAAEKGGVKRMDLREVSGPLRSLSHAALQAAFRYHKQPGEAPGLALAWTRYPDSGLVEAVVQRATVTTMATSEGKSITEVRLTVRNQAQPFLRVALPAGASIVSAEVAGEKVKPLQGTDGNRVPLLRAGFRPAGAYVVSFVFMHSGAPFEKKGGAEIALPRMDVPIGLLDWEVYLPEKYKVKDFGGDAIPLSALRVVGEEPEEWGELRGPPPPPMVEAPPMSAPVDLRTLRAGQIGGTVVDPNGGVVPNTRIRIVDPATGATVRAVTDDSGRWIALGVASGRLRIEAEAQGFKKLVQETNYDADRPARFSMRLDVGAAMESITVTASSEGPGPGPSRREAKVAAAANAPSANVVNLQQRVAGVLPVAVQVPRAGTSYRFVRPLVIDEETKVTFSYRSK